MNCKNLLLMAASIVVTLLILEGLLRATLDPTRLYSSLHEVPAFNAWKNEVDFWAQYKDRPLDSFGHDAQLGWDIEQGGDRIRGDQVVQLANPDTDMLRVVAIGDSFTYGLDVEPTENFAARLDALDGIEVLNMGVPGYGIDQACLKYVRHGQQYAPGLVLLGIYVGDYQRSTVSFTSAAKPWFEQSRGGQSQVPESTVTLHGVPVPEPEAEVERIGRALEGRWYLVELVRNAWRKARIGQPERDAFFDRGDAIVGGVLEQVQRSLSPAQRLLIVHIPRAEAFTARDSFRDEMSQRLLAIYKRLAIDYIDLRDAFAKDLPGETVYATYYHIREDGSAGHLGAAGHQRVADLIAQRLDEPGA